MTLTTLFDKIKNDIHLTSAGGSWVQALSKTTQNNLRFFLFDGILSAGQDGIVSSYLSIYLLALGATNGQIGLMSSLASLSATILLLPGAMLSEKLKKRKSIVLLAGGGISRLMILLIAIVPFLIHGSAAVLILIGAKVIADGFTNFSNPPWTSMVGDIVPLEYRGRYFGSRNLFMAAASMICTFLIGQWISPSNSIFHYQIAFIVAVIIGFLSTFSFSRIKEPPIILEKGIHLDISLKSLLDTLRSDVNFLHYILFSFIWNFGIMIAGPFFSVYIIRGLNGTASDVGLFAISGSLAAVTASRLFGRISDRWGPRRLMVVSGFLIPLIPFAWIWVKFPFQGILVNLVAGLMWAGFNLAAFNFLLSLAPSHARARYSGMFQVAVTLASAAGSAFGGVVVTHFGFLPIFALSAIGRLVGIAYFAKFVRKQTSDC
jgi:MFS family permease